MVLLDQASEHFLRMILEILPQNVHRVAHHKIPFYQPSIHSASSVHSTCPSAVLTILVRIMIEGWTPSPWFPKILRPVLRKYGDYLMIFQKEDERTYTFFTGKFFLHRELTSWRPSILYYVVGLMSYFTVMFCTQLEWWCCGKYFLYRNFFL